MGLTFRQLPELTAARALTSEHAVYSALTEEPLAADLGDWWPLVHVALTGGDPPMPRHVALAQNVEWDDDSFENVMMGGDATPYSDELSFARVVKPRDVARWSARLAEVVTLVIDDDMLSFAPRGATLEQARREVSVQLARLRACYQAAALAGDALLIAVI